MSHTQSNRVFAGLMVLAFLCAFILPSSWTEGIGLQISSVFAPVSAPTRWLANGIYNRFKHDEPAASAGNGEDVVLLRNEVLALQARIDELEKLDAERQELGNIRDLCSRVEVAGNDQSRRDLLVLSGSYLSGLANDEPALYDGAIVGRVDVGLAGARLRLLSDKGIRITGRFVRLVRDGDKEKAVDVPAPPPLIEGIGEGRLAITQLRVSDVTNLHEGDLVVLDDDGWPQAVQGRFIGTVTAVGMRPQRDFAVITVQPGTDLLGLKYVEVYTGP